MKFDDLRLVLSQLARTEASATRELADAKEHIKKTKADRRKVVKAWRKLEKETGEKVEMPS